jgi:AAA+ superfamily predicted ATPase
MDAVENPAARAPEADPKQRLIDEVERVRIEREELDRQIFADRERLMEIRSALDAMVANVWRDVYRQQQQMRGRDNFTNALSLGWLGVWQIPAGIAVLALAGLLVYAVQATGFVLALVAYLALAGIGYLVAREQCTAPIKKARASYLGMDGKDVRFVAFTRHDAGLHHPLIGYDGPSSGILEDRSWKIPGVREADALTETFVEVIDERRGNVLLSRFPDKKPTLVHADLENPFIRSYGVFFQRALERQLPHVAKEAESFREIVGHTGRRKELDVQLRRLEEELREFDGTAALIRGLMLPGAVRNRIIEQVVEYRLDDPSTRRGLFLIGSERIDMTEVLQSISRAAAATLLHLSFSQIKIGYVGQGASTVSRIFATAKRTRSIVFIDEAEKFFTTEGPSAYEAMRKEVVQALWTEWGELGSEDHVWVIAGANSRDGLDEGVFSRFGAIVDMSPGFAGAEAATIPIDAEAAAAAVAELPTDTGLAEPVLKRGRLIAAMFAHAATMEAQGITVPRAVLVMGSTLEARCRAIEFVAEQAGMPLLPTSLEELDAGLERAREAERALVPIQLPPFGDAGAIARLAVTIDRLTEAKAQIFIVGETMDAEQLDPELRSRFPESIDLTELPGSTRREVLRELLADKPLGFDLDGMLDQLEAQTEGMTQDQLRHFVDEAGRHAALRAIDAGAPDHVIVEMEDFERRVAADAATKDDEAAL